MSRKRAELRLEGHDDIHIGDRNLSRSGVPNLYREHLACEWNEVLHPVNLPDQWAWMGLKT